MNDSITVLTLTRGRADLLRRAIQSVKRQDYEGDIFHLILIDDCSNTEAILEQYEQANDRLNWTLKHRLSSDRSGPDHLAKLRNILVEMAQTKWITFLDDDNEYDANHLRCLMECAQQTGSDAVHSWLQIFNFDGTPYLTPRWPWCRQDRLGRQRYQEMVEKGVVTCGSNVIRDSINNLPDRCVDTSEWLIKRNILLNYPIPSSFSYHDWLNNKAEDDKLLMQLLTSKVKITCSQVASLKYYLGGYSTNHDGSFNHSQIWRWNSLKDSIEDLEEIKATSTITVD